jgi:hypothetical protein
MKTNYRKLGILLRWFPFHFYVISISESRIEMQGKFNPKTVLIARAHGFKQIELKDGGYLEMGRGNITITLTD